MVVLFIEREVKWMYRYSQGMNAQDVSFTRKTKRILLALLAFFVVATLTLSVVVVHTTVYERNAEKQISQRMMNCVSSAIEQVNKMSSVVNSGTSTRLGVVRQYVYTMEQLNDMSIALNGNSGRLAPEEAFTALYSDIEAFETLTQTATTSTLEARTLLLTHLSNLQLLLAESEK